MSDNKQHQKQHLALSYEGPLPTSNEFAGYERVLPGAAERILSMAEKEAEHRRENDNTLISASVRLSGRGQLIAFGISCLALAGVCLSIFFGKPVASIAPAIIAITGLASLFINKSR
jgi:uncharacterized membrane protein